MIDLSKVPPHELNEYCRILNRSIPEFISNMTPAQEEAYQRWSEEYDRKHGLTPESSKKGGCVT